MKRQSLRDDKNHKIYMRRFSSQQCQLRYYIPIRLATTRKKSRKLASIGFGDLWRGGPFLCCVWGCNHIGDKYRNLQSN